MVGVGTRPLLSSSTTPTSNSVSSSFCYLLLFCFLFSLLSPPPLPPILSSLVSSHLCLLKSQRTDFPPVPQAWDPNGHGSNSASSPLPSESICKALPGFSWGHCLAGAVNAKQRKSSITLSPWPLLSSLFG